MQKITPFLWFDGNVEEAIYFYTAAFKRAKVNSLHRMAPGGKVFTATFELAGQTLMALDGGPVYTFTPAISLFVNCETPAEIDALWQQLGDGGKVFMPLNKYPFSEKFGWVQDKFGLSWQLNLTGTEQKVTPFLMFVKDQCGKAEEAMHFYTSQFANSEVLKVAHYGAGEPGLVGTVKHGSCSVAGQALMVMDSNGAHDFAFNPSVSFFIDCQTQDEVDRLWESLSADGGGKSRCGWVWDKYGVSWQVIPTVLGELLYDKDRVKAQRVMQAMMKMDKLDIAGLQKAYEG